MGFHVSDNDLGGVDCVECSVTSHDLGKEEMPVAPEKGTSLSFFP